MKTAAEHYYNRGFRDGMKGIAPKRPSDANYMKGYEVGKKCAEIDPSKVEM